MCVSLCCAAWLVELTRNRIKAVRSILWEIKFGFNKSAQALLQWCNGFLSVIYGTVDLEVRVGVKDR